MYCLSWESSLTRLPCRDKHWPIAPMKVAFALLTRKQLVEVGSQKKVPL
jgi:hypothetical protein